MEIFILILVIHWYISLFSQTFFMHRYAAHSMFTMSKFWEKFFYFFSWLTQGSSYLSPYAYGILHRWHHAYTDTEKDPHSPIFSKNPFKLMWKTWKIFNDIVYGKVPIEEKWKKNLPEWKEFDEFASSSFSKFVWVIVYGSIYTGLIQFHHNELVTWNYIVLVPMFLCHCIMAPIHGLIINYFAHKFGYRNFDTKDESRNLLPVDVLMMGESYHNNHHEKPKPNFGVRWFEFDPVWPIIWLMNKLNIIQLKTAST